MCRRKTSRSGFTLIELSIVLVIIGLIVGGVLVGRELINAAAVRGTLAQIEKYQQAVATFKGKYGYLPGDIPDPTASSFGFLARGTNPGQGDGNGIIEGLGGVISTVTSVSSLTGETGAVWVDLYTALLIPFKSNNTPLRIAISASNATLKNWMPEAAIGRGNYIYVDGAFPHSGGTMPGQPGNYFGLSGVLSVGTSLSWEMHNSTKLTVREAYSMDSKIDDGLPQSGSVQTFYNDANINTNDSGYSSGDGSAYAVNPGSALAASQYTCGDNGGVASNPQKYSLAQNSGAGLNCSLHFKLGVQ